MISSVSDGSQQPQTVPRLRPFVARRSQTSVTFDSRPVHMRFVLHKVAMGHVFVE